MEHRDFPPASGIANLPAPSPLPAALCRGSHFLESCPIPPLLKINEDAVAGGG